MAIANWPSNVGGQILPKPAGASSALGQRQNVPYRDPITGAETGEVRSEIFLYNATGAATVIGNAYMLTQTGLVPAQLLQAAVLAAGARPREVVIATSIIPAAGYGWFALSGPVNITCSGTPAAGAHLKVATGTSTSALVTDTTGTTASVGMMATVAGASAAPTATVPNKAYMFGDAVVIA